MLLNGPNTRGEFALAEPVEFVIGKGPQAWKVTVPVGFETDFASIPWFLQGVVRKHGKADQAALLHDYMYETRMVERCVADAMFLAELKRAKTHWMKSQAMYWAVVLFGRKWYDS